MTWVMTTRVTGRQRLDLTNKHHATKGETKRNIPQVDTLEVKGHSPNPLANRVLPAVPFKLAERTFSVLAVRRWPKLGP